MSSASRKEMIRNVINSRPSNTVILIHIDSILQQLDNFGMSIVTRCVKGCVSILVLLIHIRIIFLQQLDNLGMSIVTRCVKGCVSLNVEITVVEYNSK